VKIGISDTMIQIKYLIQTILPDKVLKARTFPDVPMDEASRCRLLFPPLGTILTWQLEEPLEFSI
jgi:hypothetical protein